MAQLGLMLATLAPALDVRAQLPSPWQATQLTAQKSASQAWVQPDFFLPYSLDAKALQAILALAEQENSRPAALASTLIALPMPDGSLAQFRFVESPVMDAKLAAEFPEIKTYLGQGLDDPAATVRFDLTPAGFHAQILSPNGAVYIDPYYKGDTNTYATYYKRDYRKLADDFHCLTVDDGETTPGKQAGLVAPLAVSGANLRTYRLACAATGEYTQFHGGTVSAGLAAIVTAINRVTGVYESELAIRLVLVANNNLLVYTNASTDPYNNSNPSSLLSQNQSNIDFVIGSGNYDIGHVFSTAGGGLAGVGVACVAGLNARGETGTSSPIGDPFYIDYVAHEMGHQLGAHHTFNSTNSACNGNRTATAAYEPGSGSTIMGYAGICSPDNLQLHSDPYFHSISFEEIVNYTTTGSGNNCPVITTTGNTAPTANAGVSFSIPKGTPFSLTASGSDANGDALTYCWEERDLGPGASLGAGDNGSSPLFRSFIPSSSASRTFPQLSSILNNTGVAGEIMPATSRTLQFRVTARDNRAGGGGVASADTQVTVVSSAGPFVVTSPNTAVTWVGLQTVTWNVAGTTAAPINATNVNILLSTNGGLSFPIVLATNVPNNGSRSVILPNITTAAARVRVEAVGNIFFDVSDANFTINPATPVVVLDSATVVAEDCAATNGLVDPGETVIVNFALKNTGLGNATNLTATLIAANGVTLPGGSQSYGALVAGGATVVRPFMFTAAGACGGSITATLQLQDGASNLGTVTRVFPLGASLISTQAFTNGAIVTILDNGPSSPYPSPITVAGLAGTVTKVTATLRGLSHTYASDVDILLVGPAGQKVMLLSDVGGSNVLNNLTLTLDDTAAAALPASGPIVSGIYKPTNIDTTTDAFTAPAPAAPYATNLSSFSGLDPNGAWSLYVRDDGPLDSGAIAQGWTLSITTSNWVCCTGGAAADLAVTETVVPSIVNDDSEVTFNVTVANLGPNSASSVVVTDALPAALAFVAAVPTQGACVYSNGVLICSLGTIANGATAAVSVTATGVVPGGVTNVVSVGSPTTDFVSANNSASASLVINGRPAISPIAAQVTDQDVPTLPIPFVVGDAETPAGALAVFAASSNPFLVPDANMVLGGSGSNRTLTITPASQLYGSATISLTVTDGLASATSFFQLTVNPVNHSPILDPIPDQVVTEGIPLTLSLHVSDADLPPQNLVISLATNAPVGATITPEGSFSWTPTEAQGPSTNVLTVFVTDSGVPSLSATQSFTVIVLETNAAPVLAPIADQTVIEGMTLIITNTATDSDLPANTLTFGLETNAPAGATVNITNGVFTWTPSEAQGPSTNLITVRVTDDGMPSLSATQSFTVIVLETNAAPLLAPIADQTIIEGQMLIVTNSASDSDLPANLLTFGLETNSPDGANINPNTGLLTWTPAGAQVPSTNILTVRVTDDGTPSLSATQSFTVVVLETLARALPPIPDQVVTEGQTLIITNLCSGTNLMGLGLTFGLDTNAPAGAAINPTNGLFTWTPTEAQGPATNLITIIVAAAALPSSQAAINFQIIVLETNSAPVLSPITDRVIHAGATLMLTAAATDADLPANLLTFSLNAAAPGGSGINPTNGLLTWQTSEADSNTTNSFTVTVTDDGTPSLSAAQTFNVIVVARPKIISLTVSNGVATLAWCAIAGQTYRIEYRDALDSTNWSALPNDVVADSPIAMATDPVSTVPQRFYRVLNVSPGLPARSQATRRFEQ